MDLTEELRGLLSDTLRRLAGTGGEAVVQLRTPFGGGKTHALIALYHLVKAAADIESMADVRELLRGVGLDRELGGEYAKLRLAQTVVTAIFMYAHSGGGERGVGEPRLRLSLIRPGGVTPTLLSDALSRLKGRLYYLYGDGSWTFRAQANLNAVLSERMGQIQAKAVRERFGSALASKAGGGVLKPYLWPESHKDVPDTQGLKLVVLSPEAPVESGERERLMDTIQNNHASGPRINKNGLLYLAGRAEDFSRVEGAARTLLALEDIERDRGLALSDDQRRDLAERLNKARSGLPEAAKACYNKLFEPVDAASREYRVHDVSAPVKTSPTLTAAATEVLRAEDRLLNALDPALITSGPYGLWPEGDESLPLRNLREYFLRFPHLPYLENDEVLRAAVVRGVKNGLFELGLKKDGAYTQVWRWMNPPGPSDLFFAEHYLLTRPGVIAPASSETATPPDTAGQVKPGTGAGAEVGTGVNTGGPSRPAGARAPGPKTRVSLTFDSLEVGQLPTLVDVVYALEDAKGDVKIQVLLTATNTAGLDETTLDLSVRELVAQHGLKADWEEG